jgi:dihydroorotase
MGEFLIINATIVNEEKKFIGNVRVSNDIIDEIVEGYADPSLIKTGETVIDAKGKLLLPGVIDDQVHFRDPGFPEKGDIYTESRAAVAGGVTSFMDMPNTLPQTTTIQLLNNKFNHATEKSIANYSFFLGATNDNLDEIKKVDPSRVCGVKVFMGSSTGNMLVNDEKTLQGIFAESPVLIATHCEEESIIQNNIKEYRERYGEDVPINCHPLIRSAEACYISTARAVTLAEKYHSRLHVLHVSTAKELNLFSDSPDVANKQITSETCVHYLWFDDNDYDKLGTLIKWNPAIKSRNDRLHLMEGLKKGYIDIIATDHAPHTISEKQNTYFKAPSGGPLVQHSLSVMLELVAKDEITLEQVVRKMCHAPALLYGIKNRGFIRKGYFADLVIVDPDSKWTVSKENILYKCKWSPFEGQTFQNSVVQTFVNGNLVYTNGEINNEKSGRELSFSR